MHRTIIVFACLLSSVRLCVADDKGPVYPSFDYETARTHEIKPHRRTVPLKGVTSGFNQLHITLVVSPSGDVMTAVAGEDDLSKQFWPEVSDEVLQWRFMPFEEDGKAVAAQVEEYIDLVPPEKLPKKHIPPPVLSRSAKIEISLERTGCYGSCPSYEVTVTNHAISFDGRGNVVASGKHSETIEAGSVRKLARKFIVSDFYSMDNVYRAGVTDNPTYVLSVSISGNKKSVEDYVGSWVGMPAVIHDLEDAVDALADTTRWIEGGDGLVDSLQAEKFNFETFDAQVILKAASERGKADTVQELLDAGVPLDPLPAPKPKEEYMGVPFEHVGWLNAASRDLETLKVLVNAGASKDDQVDKDLALVGAARSGNIEGVRALIAYGANPNADLSKRIVAEEGGGMTLEVQGAGSVLIYAAESGNPEMVREILSFHPNVEMKDREGRTAIFSAGEYRYGDKDGARVECVRLLAEAGANVNATDNDGNTPLHGIFLTDVEEELLKLGANVNARNKDGETPIFTNVDDAAIPLFIQYGADLNIRNSKGQTVVEAAEEKGPSRQEALRKAIEESKLQ